MYRSGDNVSLTIPFYSFLFTFDPLRLSTLTLGEIKLEIGPPNANLLAPR